MLELEREVEAAKVTHRAHRARQRIRTKVEHITAVQELLESIPEPGGPPVLDNYQPINALQVSLVTFVKANAAFAEK